MAKSLNILVDSLIEILSNYSPTDDFPIKRKFIEDELVSVNQTLIRKAYVERRITNDLYLLHLCGTIQEEDNNIEINGIIFKPKSKLCYVSIPSLISGIGGLEIDFVASEGFTITFNRKPLKALINESDGYYNILGYNYSVLGDKIYFLKEELESIKNIVVNGIWKDPRVASSWDSDKDFPTPSEYNLEVVTIKHIMQGMSLPVDLINDAERALMNIQKTNSNGNNNNG